MYVWAAGLRAGLLKLMRRMLAVLSPLRFPLGASLGCSKCGPSPGEGPEQASATVVSKTLSSCGYAFDQMMDQWFGWKHKTFSVLISNHPLTRKCEVHRPMIFEHGHQFEDRASHKVLCYSLAVPMAH